MTQSVFQFRAAEIKYTETRRGVNAFCPIRKGGTVVGYLDDRAEAIVADVSFADPQDKVLFLAEARSNGAIDQAHGDSYLISEHARAMSLAAEQEYAASMPKSLGKKK